MNFYQEILMNKKALNTISDIKQFFKQSESVYYFISATNFNLMAISDWVKNWFNINTVDCYDKNNNYVILPEEEELPVLTTIEEINLFLLSNKKILNLIDSYSVVDNHVIFLFYDKYLETRISELGMYLIMPPNERVKFIDNKINTTEIGNNVNVPSVPNALVKISSYRHLKSVIEKYNLSNDVVIQTAYGDSGKTTFFISNEEQYQQYADQIEAENQVKVMKHIKCLQVAMEACTTRNGTYVGPILTEIIGHPKLTPYKGGWCGNDVNPDIFDNATQKIMFQYSEQLGKGLYDIGYRGYFEIDYLVDVSEVGQPPRVYLGEINPRITGVSALTNMSAFCQQNIPLFLFHLLEFSDVEFNLKPDVFNQTVQSFKHPAFGQLIFKYTNYETKIITSIAKSGVYNFLNNKLTYLHYADNPSQLSNNEVYILRILKNHEYLYKGADIFIIFVCEQLQDKNNVLTPIAENLIKAVKQLLEYRSLTSEENQMIQRYGRQATIKTSDDTS